MYTILKAFCIGRNFIEHTKELQNELPDEPVVFIKPAECFFSTSDKRVYLLPPAQVHYEIELVVRFAETLDQHISKKKRTLKCIDAITVGIDFTNRTKQQELKKKGLPWEKAKAFYQSAFLGKWVDIGKYISKVNELKFELKVDNCVVQKGFSRDMIWSIEDIIQHLIVYFPINRGDVLFCGTPRGVGVIKKGNNLKGYLEDIQVFDFDY